MRGRIALAWLGALLLIQGCVNSAAMRMGTETYPARPDDYPIDVFVPAEAPVVIAQAIPDEKSIAITKETTKEELKALLPVGSTVIGKIDSNGAPAASWESVINDAKKKARTLGGDGIIIGQWGQPLTGFGPYGMANYGKSLSFAVLRYR